MSLILDLLLTRPSEVRNSLRVRRASRVAEAVEAVIRFFTGLFFFIVLVAISKLVWG